MNVCEFNHNQISTSLTQLLEMKSARDGVNFTIRQLAAALNMPHSILVKLMHSNIEKRTTNPKIETLTRIITFFRADGFNISLDDLLFGINDKAIYIEQQQTPLDSEIKKIPIRAVNFQKKTHLGFVTLSATTKLQDPFAIEIDEDINEIIKKGSIFIIDSHTQVEEGTLVVVTFENQTKIEFKKIFFSNSNVIFKSLNDRIPDVVMQKNHNYMLHGTVMQIQISTKV